MKKKQKKQPAPKRDLFPYEYIKDLNQTQAAIRSGYSSRTAHSHASRMMKDVNVQAKIRELKRKRELRCELSADAVLHELSLIGFSDLSDFVGIDYNTGVIIAKGFDQMPPGASRAIEAIKEDRAIKETSDGESVVVYDKVTFKLHSKIKALELLGRHLALFNDDIKGKIIFEHQLSIKEMKKSEKKAKELKEEFSNG